MTTLPSPNSTLGHEPARTGQLSDTVLGERERRLGSALEDSLAAPSTTERLADGVEPARLSPRSSTRFEASVEIPPPSRASSWTVAGETAVRSAAADAAALDDVPVTLARGGAVTFGSAETIDRGRPADPAQVAEEVQIVMQTFIPYDTVPATRVDIEAGITVPLPAIRDTYVHGDAASHTQPGQDDSYLDDQGFRTQQIITLQFDAAGNQIGHRDVIKRVGESLGYVDPEGTQIRSRATASPDSLSQSTTPPSIDGRPGSVTVIQFDNETSIPSTVVPIAPGITNDTRVTIRQRPNAHGRATLADHDP